MNQIRAEFLEIYRCALHDRNFKPTQVLDIEKTKELADRHNVWPLIFTVLKEAYPNEVPCEKWAEYRNAFFYMCVKNMQHMYALRKLLSALDKAAIPYAVLKGESLASLYPHPECRVSSDIDIYVSPEDESRAVDVFTKCGVQVEPRIPHAHHRDCKSNACGKIELHIQWQGDLQSDILYDNTLNATEAFVQAQTEALGTFYTLGVNDGLYMNFAHLLTHFVSGGFGIRLISDLLLYIRKYKKELDEDAFRAFLTRLGYNKFMDALFSIGTQYLEFKKEDFFKFTECTDVAELLLEDCLTGGAFGHAESGRHDTHDAYLKERMENEGKDMGAYMSDYRASGRKEKLSFSLKNLENLYSYLRKSRWLLPVAYVHHTWFILTRGFAKLAKKKAAPVAMHENAEKRQILFEKLELKKR